LGSWALDVSSLVSRFFVQQHPFLLESLVHVDLGIVPFQQHLIFSPYGLHLYVFFKLLFLKQIKHFKNSILVFLFQKT